MTSTNLMFITLFSAPIAGQGFSSSAPSAVNQWKKTGRYALTAGGKIEKIRLN